MKSKYVLEHLGTFATSFVFGFCTFIAIIAISFCVPKNFDERTSPLPAYRKVMRFRLLFDSIRSPKEGQKGFQPDKGVQPERPLRLEFLHFKGVLSGTYRSGGRYHPLRQFVKTGSLPGFVIQSQPSISADRIRPLLLRKSKTGFPFSLFLNFIFSTLT